MIDIRQHLMLDNVPKDQQEQYVKNASTTLVAKIITKIKVELPDEKHEEYHEMTKKGTVAEIKEYIASNVSNYKKLLENETINHTITLNRRMA